MLELGWRGKDAGKKVWEVGERVGVAVAKKDVVGEVWAVVGDVGGESVLFLAVEVEEVVVVLPEDTTWWFVGQMKTGRPIVSFASVSIFACSVLFLFASWVRCLLRLLEEAGSVYWFLGFLAFRDDRLGSGKTFYELCLVEYRQPGQPGSDLDGSLICKTDSILQPSVDSQWPSEKYTRGAFESQKKIVLSWQANQSKRGFVNRRNLQDSMKYCNRGNVDLFRSLHDSFATQQKESSTM